MNRGFTIVELMTVIAVIGILSAIIVPSLNGMRVKARDTERVTDVKNLQVAIERYYNRESVYPGSGSGLLSSCDSGWSSGLQDLLAEGLVTSLPIDPRNTDSYCYEYVNGGSCNGSNGYTITFTPEDEGNLEDTGAYEFSDGRWCFGG